MGPFDKPLDQMTEAQLCRRLKAVNLDLHWLFRDPIRMVIGGTRESLSAERAAIHAVIDSRLAEKIVALPIPWQIDSERTDP